MNKLIGAGLIGFGLGLATGTLVLYFLNKKKEKNVTENDISEEATESVEEQEQEPVPVEEKVKEMSSYNELISDLQYRDQHDEDMTADPLTEEEQEILDDYLISQERKEFKERNWGKIEEISAQEFDDFLYENGSKFDGWEGEDLYFFQDEQSITDSIGSLLTAAQVAQNIGDCLDVSDFRNDSREHLYVACYDVETIFDIRKIVSKTRDEFFM